jgi:RHS repeat-associated protein
MNKRAQFSLFISLGCLLFARPMFAQAGNDNPGGVTNEYHGSSEVAGQLDPYTGSARREIDDIVVAGSIGAYPLKFTRILATRGGGSPNQFGEGGGWSHSYAWGLWVLPDDPNYCEDGHYCGPVGRLTYPGGGGVDFWSMDDVTMVYDMNGKHGTRDKLVNTAVGYWELWRGDGGRVLFYNGRAYQIIDPYGQTTTLDYDGSFRLSRITEPGGRYLEFFYQTFSYMTQTNPPMLTSEDVISMVRSNDGRGNTIETVSYAYEWVWIANAAGSARMYNLKTVSYDDATQASYVYEAANTNYSANSMSHESAQVVHSCDDPRYAGPMKQIQYQYVLRGEAAPDYVARGQVKAEKNLLGQVVTQITFPTSAFDPTRLQRTETRGDGPSRLFTYPAVPGASEFSFTWTDFKNHTFTDTTVGTLPGWRTTDARQNITTYETEPILDALRKITRPPTYGGESSTVEYTFTDPNNPYFHYGEKDENGNWTYFDRDANNRVWRIRYPDQSTEQFTYNSFGQVLTHKLRTDGWETFAYDENLFPSRGLKTSSYPPPTDGDYDPGSHRTRYYYYDTGPNTDRLHHVVDPRGNATWYEYNQRGQVTKVTHQDGTYTQSDYNPDGTLAWTADENHPGAATDPNQRTRYIYDEYKRVRTVTNPMGETTTNWYGLDSAWQNPLLHTTNNPKYTTSPMGKNVVYEYDENFRKKYQGVALGTIDAVESRFDYDAVGNLNWTRDARWNVTTFEHDARNRKIWMDNPIASDRNSSGHTMNWKYDGVGNRTKETRADDTFRSWDYDSMNGLWHAYDWRTNETPTANQTTTYAHDVTNTTRWITDTKGAVYTFQYDALNRKTAATYPIDATGTAREERFFYDIAGNLSMYRNPAGKYKHLNFADSYDARNRLRHSAWTAGRYSMAVDSSIGQEIVTNYDNASRVTSIVTNGGETTVAFGYDAANRQISEDQTLAGYPTRRVDTPVDADGNRMSLQVGTVYQIRYDYTQRNQLANIYGGGWEPWFHYTYNETGNITKRQALLGGTNDSINAPAASYDGLNRPTIWENTKAGDAWFARSHYQYDKVGRELATWRDEDNGSGSNRGEKFWYTATNHLWVAEYNAEQVWTDNPVNQDRWVAYTYTPDMLNRSNVNDLSTIANYTTSALNQYTSVNGETIYYDNNFNVSMRGGWFYYYDAQNRLASVRDYTGALRLQNTYDGLGRCVKRDRHDWGDFVELITYDGWKPTVEWDGAGNFKAWNIYGAGPDEILWRYQTDVGHTHYHHDIHGNVTALLDWGGNVIEKYTYDAFGLPKVVDGWDTNWQYPRTWSSYGNRFMFTGREYYPGLWLYDYRHRWYDPSLGRFLQVDPVGLQTEGEKLTLLQQALYSPGGVAPEAFATTEMNLFRYCGDDPVDKSDPTGLTLLSNLRLLRDFLFGTGQRERTYDGNSVETREMANSPAVQAARNQFNKSGHKSQFFGYGSEKAFGETVIAAAIPLKVVKLPYLPPLPGLKNILSSENLGSTAAQVGGFRNASISNNGDGTATYHIRNVAGANSFFYHVPPNRQGTTGPLRSIIQNFHWTENIEGH